MGSRMKELEQDCKFYKEVNAQLDLNQAELEKAKAAAEDECRSTRAESEARIKDLEEQVPMSRFIKFSGGLRLYFNTWSMWCA